MLELRDLLRIQAVVTHGGFTRAATALGMTQPALTRSIAAAERLLRGPLFRRGRMGAEPTALCRLVLADAPEIIRRMQDLHDRIGQLRGGSGEELAVATGPFPMDTICLPAIAAFRATHPRIRVRLETLPWPAALAQLRARLCDLAVVTAGATFDGDAFAVEPLPKQRLVFAVAPGHPLAALRRPGVGRVLGYPLVTTAHLSVRLHKALAEARGEAGGRRADLPCPAVQVESPPAWISLAAAGGHVALTSLAAASGAIARGEVVVLPVEAPWLATEPAIVQLAERPPSQSARDFGAALRAANAASVATAEAMWTALTQGRAAP